MTTVETLDFSSYGSFAPIMQALCVLGLAVFIIVIEKRERQKNKDVLFRSPLRLEAILSIVYEEVLFRGIILLLLLNIFSIFVSIAISSILFGAWQLRNAPYQTRMQTIYQVLYSVIIFGPAASSITILSAGSLWEVIVFHIVHNIISNFIKRRTLKFN